ncbi:MAG: hypothetical protein RIC16_13965 [Rhodospirillales bacterium]
MSDTVLVRTGDGKLIYLQRNSYDRQDRQRAGTSTGAETGDKTGANATSSRPPIEDIVDISAGLRAANEVRAETDPEKIKEKVETGKRRIDENLSKFFSLFAASSVSSSPFGRFLDAMSFRGSGSSWFGPSSYLDRFIGALFGRGRRGF